MTFFVTFIVLAMAGIADAGYLVYEHRRHEPLVCPLDHDCSVVTESRWANIFGIRNEILGLGFYVVMLAGILLVSFEPSLRGSWLWGLGVLSGGALAFSLFLTAVQLFVIKDYCFYCLISALLTLLLFINSVFLYNSNHGTL